MKDPTKRFSDRVENYVKYRPGYPGEIIDLFRSKCRLTNDSTIADIASGTGIFTELLLRHGYNVLGVEPNREMRAAAERLLSRYDRFKNVDGTAEFTTLDDQSVDIITAAQAFHWFDRKKARGEFLRIQKPNGWVALLWNERLTSATPFLAAYEDLLTTYATDYGLVNHRKIDANVLKEFFAPATYETDIFPNHQNFDYKGLKGRLLSSSYAPNLGDQNHLPMMAELDKIFSNHNIDGMVRFEFTTRVHLAQLS